MVLFLHFETEFHHVIRLARNMKSSASLPPLVLGLEVCDTMPGIIILYKPLLLTHFILTPSLYNLRTTYDLQLVFRS